MTDDILSGTKRIGVKRTDRSVEVSPKGYLVAGKITEELQEILLSLAEDDLDWACWSSQGKRPKNEKRASFCAI